MAARRIAPAALLLAAAAALCSARALRSDLTGTLRVNTTYQTKDDPLDTVEQELVKISQLNQALSEDEQKRIEHQDQANSKDNADLVASNQTLQSASEALRAAADIARGAGDNNTALNDMRESIRRFQEKDAKLDAEVAALRARHRHLLERRANNTLEYRKRRSELLTELASARDAIARSRWMASHLEAQAAAERDETDRHTAELAARAQEVSSGIAAAKRLLDENKTETEALKTQFLDAKKAFEAAQLAANRTRERHEKAMKVLLRRRSGSESALSATNKSLSATQEALAETESVIDEQKLRLVSLRREEAAVKARKDKIDALSDELVRRRHENDDMRMRAARASDEAAASRERAADAWADAKRKDEELRQLAERNAKEGRERASEIASAVMSLRRARGRLSRVLDELREEESAMSKLREAEEAEKKRFAERERRIQARIDMATERFARLRDQSGRMEESLKLLREHWTELSARNRNLRQSNMRVMRQRDNVARETESVDVDVSAPVVAAAERLRDARDAIGEFARGLQRFRAGDVGGGNDGYNNDGYHDERGSDSDGYSGDDSTGMMDPRQEERDLQHTMTVLERELDRTTRSTGVENYGSNPAPDAK